MEKFKKEIESILQLHSKHTNTYNSDDALKDIIEAVKLLPNENAIFLSEVAGDDSFSYKLKDGQQIIISKTDMGLVKAIRRLPVYAIIDILQIDENEITKIIEAKKSYDCELCLLLLKCKPVWRETGEYVEFNDDSSWKDVTNCTVSKLAATTQLKSKKISNENLENIKSFLIGDEVYYKQDLPNIPLAF